LGSTPKTSLGRFTCLPVSSPDVFNNLKMADKKTLLLTPDYDNNVYLSSRNIPNAQVMNVSDVNTYSILHANNIILVEGSINKLKETLS
jgi:large subunit ribosomal protein L4